MKNFVTTLLLTVMVVPCFSQASAIGHVQVTYIDSARSNRPIQTEIYYPSVTAGESVPMSAGTYPVIVFGHGFVMTWSAYQNIWQSFVPHGYVVAFPTTESGFSPVHAEFGADLAFLVGAIQQDGSSNMSSLFYSHIGSTSALMGHSMGGGSSFLAASGNSSITTMITFAAANTNPSSIIAAQNVSQPSLVISGQNDCVAPSSQHQTPMFDSLASNCKAYIEILGGGHCYFAETNFNCSFGEGTCSPSPTITRMQQQDAAQDFSLMWLDYYLKGNCSALTNFNDSLIASNRVTGSTTCPISSPSIAIVGNDLQSTNAISYQWLLNGAPIVGANAQLYTPLQSGVYAVVVTYPSISCTDTSNVISWIIAATNDEALESEVNIFPSPAYHHITIEYSVAESAVSQFIVTDLSGRMVKQIIAEPHSTSISIGVDDLAPGTYFLNIVLAEGRVSQCKQFHIVRQD